MNPSWASEHDPFKSMLVWSGVFHVVFFTSFLLAARLYKPTSVLPPPGVTWMVMGSPGPGSGFGGGGSPPPPTEKAAPSKPPEPEKEEPRVVRPTKEDRNQLPMPDAAKSRNRQPKKAKTSSGLRGSDSTTSDSARLQGAGAPGLGLGGTGGGSAFDQDFEYAYYVQQMLARISQHWQRVPVRGQAVVIIKFTIFRDGRIGAVEVEQSSGLAMLDNAAARAVYLVDPLPPLPNSYPRDQVGVHLQFTYSDRYRDG